MPVYYGIRHCGSDFDDQRHEGEIDTTRTLTFEGHLDEEVLRQETACAAVMEALLAKEGTALLALPPGGGKTTSACHIIAELGLRVGGIVPTWVLVHKDYLIDQWIERVHQYLPGATVGVAKRNQLPEHCDIIIGTIQSLITPIRDDQNPQVLLPRYDETVMRRFGFLIIDEAHHISADKFRQSFPLTGMRRVLLLSGTPERVDGAHLVAEAWTGPVTFQTRRIYTRQVWLGNLATVDRVLT
jgi:superfamily II DNA or RNA helicase